MPNSCLVDEIPGTNTDIVTVYVSPHFFFIKEATPEIHSNHLSNNSTLIKKVTPKVYCQINVFLLQFLKTRF